ncbi:MAG: hypothetical protein E6J34_02670 [Chloroflexi bacterium]|nr:MAG: hypothetical protein E6J34_02670 [Chloroflexota bacterium]
MVSIGSDDKKVYAIDTKTGHQIWAFQTHDFVRFSPTAESGVL